MTAAAALLPDMVAEVLERLARGGLTLDAELASRAASVLAHIERERVDASATDGATAESLAILDELRELAARLAVADRTREAEVLVRGAHAVREATTTGWSIPLATELRVLAEICRREGRTEEALEALLKAKRLLAGQEATEDLATSAELARTLNDLALMLQRSGKLTKASHEMRRAIELFDVVARADAEDRRAWHELGVAWSNQGVLLGALGKKQEATEAFLHALDGLTAEADPLRWAQVLHNLGVHLTEIGEPARGSTMLEQALEVRRNALGDDDSRLPKTLLALARAYDGSGEAERALPLAREAFARAQRHFPPGHAELEQARETLVGLLEGAGLLEEAALHQRTDDYDVC